MDAYHTNVFYIPRHIPSKQKVSYKKTSNSQDEIFEQVNAEVREKHEKGMPVLVIMPSKDLAEKFSRTYYPLANMITGVELDRDRESIKAAGNAGAITIATNAAGRGIDIILSPAAKKNGGLHVVIPMMPENERVLEQAMGRSARQGQPGAVSVYYSGDERFLTTPDFDDNYEKLLELQERFASYTREKWPWLYEREQKYNCLHGEYQLGVTAFGVLKKASRELAMLMPTLGISGQTKEVEEILSDTMLQMVLLSWGMFFTER